MKKILSIFLFSGLIVLLSCDDTVDSDMYGKGASVAGFVNASKSVNTVADGTVYPFQLQMEVKGPRIDEVNGDITATIATDPSSEAKEGTHFKLSNSSVTLGADNNHLALFDFEVLTAGIQAPLQVEAVLIISQASGDNNVIPSQKPISITINYGCPSDLAGTYDLSIEYTAYDGSVSNYNYVDIIKETGIGEYRTTIDHHWEDLGVGTPGFTFYDVCDVISGPGQLLADYYGNWVDFIEGTHDPSTGTINMTYSICFPAGADNCRYYKNVWVKQ